MIGKALQQYATDLGLTVSEKCAYGVFNGFLVTMYDTVSKKTVFVNYYLDDSQESAVRKFNLSESIKKSIDEYQIEDYQVEDNGVTVIIKDSIVKLSEYLPILIDSLTEVGMTGISVCSECGSEITGEAKKAAVSLKRYGLCNSCALELIQKMNKLESDAVAEDENSKKPHGFLAALICFLVGSAAWIVTYALEVFGDGNNIILAFLLSFIFPIITIKLYDMMHGSKGKKKIATVCVSMFLMIVVGMYFGSFFEYLNSNGASFKLMLDPINWSLPFESAETSLFSIPIVKEALVSVLAGAISILLFISNLFKSKNVSSKIELD
ncbi:MAG TPA: hypothetical protein PLT66_08310 [Bacillota bacterium]|nr:hypothetical protein [Bacillota bacterium]